MERRGRHCIRFSKRGNICIRRHHQMICRCSTQFRCKGCAAEVVKFVCVDLKRESERAGLGQDLTRLFQSKGFCLAKDVHKRKGQARRVSLPPLLEHWKHSLRYFVRIPLRIVFEFRGNGVCTEKGDRKVKRALIIQGGQSFKQTQLCSRLQTVTRFCFSSGGTVSEHTKQARAGLSDERFHAGGTRCLGR